MRRLLGALTIVAATLAAYAPCLRGSWLWDDGLEITGNAALRAPSGWWTPWLHPSGMDYFPLKGSFQWMEWHLWGAHPLGYHGANVALHALSALLLWRLLSALRVRWGFLGGLLFAVHPLAVESVAWISEFKNASSLPFLLLSAIAFVESDCGGGRAALVRSALWFAAALACKTSVVMFPFSLLLYAWWRRGVLSRRDFAVSAPFFALSLAMGAATVWFQSHRSIGIAGPPEGIGARLAEAGWSIMAYLRMSVWPAGLSPVYPRAPGPAALAAAWIVVAAISGVAWAARRAFGRHLLLGWGWFLLNLVPALGFIPMAYFRVAPRADHFAYVSLVGIVGLAAAGAGALGARLGGSRGRLLWPAAAAVAALLAFTSNAYARAYRSEEALWNFAVARNPGSWLARNNLGKVLYQEGNVAGAQAQFGEAVSLEPDSPEAHANMGNCLEALARPAEARAQYRAAIAISPHFAGAHYNLGLSLLKSGLPGEAAREFTAALKSDPEHAGARNSLGLSLAGEGRINEAVEQYRMALGINPDLPEAHVNLGNAFFRLGRLEDAVGEYRRALALDPGYSGAHHNLGLALEKLGRTGEAEQEFLAARRQPGH